MWDVGKGEAVSVVDCHPDVIYSISFNKDGSRLATTCKDKKLRVLDPRTGFVISVSFNEKFFYMYWFINVLCLIYKFNVIRRDICEFIDFSWKYVIYFESMSYDSIKIIYIPFILVSVKWQNMKTDIECSIQWSVLDSITNH